MKTPYIPIQTERLYEQIVEQIESRIVSGEMIVGSQLPPERELAEQFGVSRTAVREAVKILREKGLIEILPGRGTFVTNGTTGAMRQSLDLLMKFGSLGASTNLMEVSEMLEPEIAAIAATRMTNEYVSTLRKAVEQMDTALDNVEIYVDADLEFHLALAEATQNPIIPALVDTIIDLLHKQRKYNGLVEGGLQRSQIYHKKILEAVILKDPQAARLAMQSHLKQVRQDLKTSINR